MMRKRVLFLLVFIISINFSLALSPHPNKQAVTQVIDEVANWYNLTYGAEYEATRQLMIEVANQESHMGTYSTTYEPGYGYGFAQFDPGDSHFVYVQNKFGNNSQRAQAVLARFGFDPRTISRQEFDEIGGDIKSAVFLREYIYWMTGKDPYAELYNLDLRANWWKKYYNTVAGAGTVSQYKSNNLVRTSNGYDWVFSGEYASGKKKLVSEKNVLVEAFVDNSQNACPTGFVFDGDSTEVTCTDEGFYYDDLACLVVSEQDNRLDYTYFNPKDYLEIDTFCNLKTASVNNAEEFYKYDLYGNLLSEEYSSNSAYNFYYAYDSENKLVSLKNQESKTIFQYNSQDLVSKQIDFVSGKTVSKSFNYDSENRLVSVSSGGKTITYDYDSEDNLVYVNKDGAEENFEYDSEGYLASYQDPAGFKADYQYEDVAYSCSDGTDCSYKRVFERDLAKFETSYMYDSEDNIISNCVDSAELCLENVESEQQQTVGYVVEDAHYQYIYDSQYGKLMRVSSKVYLDEYADYSYDDVGNIANIAYSDGDYEKFHYNPLGEAVVLNAKYGSSVSSTPLTGAVVKNLLTGFATLFTGRVVESGSSEETYIINLAGSGETHLTQTAEEFEKNSEQELKGLSECNDYDLEDYFLSSFVIDDLELYYDSCKDNSTLLEYVCGFSFNLFDPKTAKTKSVECENGCFEGACMPLTNTTLVIEEPVLECVNDSGCLSGYSCQGNSCIFIPLNTTNQTTTVSNDLPPSPEELG